ncbi:MAG TPA: hypothetical protein VFE65_30075 [Pseudonocardia sp.]|jgi:hypothetical protein|nr:hypothetical protein [Pseudonocardia sp.]
MVAPGQVPTAAPPHLDSPAPRRLASSFLPLTLSTIRESPRLTGLGDYVTRAELAANDSWCVLLGGCRALHTRSRHFGDRLRSLSEAVGDYVPEERHQRVTGYEQWATEALHSGDGAEFALACAGYDATLAHALVTGVTGGAGGQAP